MKTKLFSALLLGVLCVLMTACPYTSTVPIDSQSVKIKQELIGKWVKSADLSNEKPSFYDIQKLNDTKYKIVNNEYNTYDSTYTITNYFGHLSLIDQTIFLNMQKDGTGDYYLYKIAIGSNEFTLFEVTDNIDEKFNTSAELKAFIKKNMALSFFYNKEEVTYIKEN